MKSLFQPVRVLCIQVLVLLFCPLSVAHAELVLGIGRLEMAGLSLEDVHAAIGAEGDSANLTIGVVRWQTHQWRHIGLHCKQLKLDQGRIDCREGRLQLPDSVGLLYLDVYYDPAASSHVSVRWPDEREVILLVRQNAQGQVDATLNRLSVARLTALLRPWVDLNAWGIKGILSGKLRYAAAADKKHVSEITFKGALEEFAFSSADGLYATEDTTLDIDMKFPLGARRYGWNGVIEWRKGEAYFHPLYLKNGIKLTTVGEYDAAAKKIQVTRGRFDLPGVDVVSIRGTYDIADNKLINTTTAIGKADLAVFGPTFIAPWVAPAHIDTVKFTGMLSAGINFGEHGLVDAAVADFSYAGIHMTLSELGFGPITGKVVWRSDKETSGQLKIGGGYWQKLALGAFDVNIHLHGDEIDFDDLSVPILDGMLEISGLELRRDKEGWNGSGAARITPISMKKLTEMLGLPEMPGKLSATLPRLTISPGLLKMDGTMALSLFGGAVRITNLMAIEPFGAASRLYADIEAERIDLAQLTNTFAFGSISGLVDVTIKGLELVHWRPVRFDARIANSPGHYQKRISQRAVENIGALGGAGALQAIQRGILRFFDSFGYSKLGLACKLDDGVCQLSGIDGGKGRDDQGFVIIQGGGIPALNVIGYNRRMDWNELLDRLKRIIEENASPTIQ